MSDLDHLYAERYKGALERYKAALLNIGEHCRNFTTGPGSCWRDNRDPHSPYGADRVCDGCIAWAALHPSEHAKTLEPPTRTTIAGPVGADGSADYETPDSPAATADGSVADGRWVAPLPYVRLRCWSRAVAFHGALMAMLGRAQAPS